MSPRIESIIDDKAVPAVKFVPRRYVVLMEQAEAGQFVTKVSPSIRKGKMVLTLQEGAFLETDAPDLPKLATHSATAVLDDDGVVVSLKFEEPAQRHTPAPTGKKSSMSSTCPGFKV